MASNLSIWPIVLFYSAFIAFNFFLIKNQELLSYEEEVAKVKYIHQAGPGLMAFVFVVITVFLWFFPVACVYLGALLVNMRSFTWFCDFLIVFETLNFFIPQCFILRPNPSLYELVRLVGYLRFINLSLQVIFLCTLLTAHGGTLS